jgi:hypothetical protein
MHDDFGTIRQALGSELPLSATERTADIVDEMLAEAVSTATSAGVAA